MTSYPFADTNAAKARIAAYVEKLVGFCELSLYSPGSQHPEGIRHHASWMHLRPLSRSFVARAFGELAYTIVAAYRLRRSGALLVTIPSMFLVILPLLLRSPIVLDVRDLAWEYLDGTSMTHSIVRSMMRWASTRAFARAALVIVTNETERDYVVRLLERADPSKRPSVCVVRNGISLERFKRLAPVHDGFRSERLKTILYAGNVGIAQDLSTFVRAAAHHPDVEFRIVGDGRDRERVSGIARSLNAANVTFFQGVGWEMLLDHYAASDALYAQITDEYRSAVPSKIAEYAATGRPMIFGFSGVASRYSKQFDNADVVEPSSVDQLVRAVERLKRRYRTESEALHRSASRSVVQERLIRESQVDGVLDVVLHVASL